MRDIHSTSHCGDHEFCINLEKNSIHKILFFGLKFEEMLSETCLILSAGFCLDFFTRDDL